MEARLAQEFAKRIDRSLIPAVPVPFEENGRMDESAQAAYIGWMAGQPIAGVAVWVHTGRGLYLTAEQRRRVLAAWRSGLPADRVIVAGVGAPVGLAGDDAAGLRAARQMAEEAASGGADALLVHPPGLPSAQIVRYHAEPGARRPAPAVVLSL